MTLSKSKIYWNISHWSGIIKIKAWTRFGAAHPAALPPNHFWVTQNQPVSLIPNQRAAAMSAVQRSTVVAGDTVHGLYTHVMNLTFTSRTNGSLEVRFITQCFHLSPICPTWLAPIRRMSFSIWYKSVSNPGYLFLELGLIPVLPRLMACSE